MKKMFVDTEFLSSSNSSDDKFSASEMEVKLVKFHEENNEMSDGLTLGFFLDNLSQVVPAPFSSSSHSIPFGRIVKAGEVIQTLSKLPPDERKNVHVAVNGVPIQLRGTIGDAIPQPSESWSDDDWNVYVPVLTAGRGRLLLSRN